jgi:DNA repair protein SbcC/Rad50
MDNLWLQEIELNNFQKHASLKLQFNEGVTIVYGASDAGKSCIRRAISFLFFNEPHGESIRKIGTKQTSVRGLLSNGWEVTRIKSASINRIIISKDGVEKVFDSVGATTPEEVQKILEVRELTIDKEVLNLNISKQITLPFLYDKPATFRAKLFNLLTGNDLIDKIVQNFNKELLSISRDLKVENEFVTKNEPELLQLKEQIDNKKSIYTSLRDKLEQIKCNIRDLKGLQQKNERLTLIKEQVEKYKEELKKYIKSIDSNKLEEIRSKTAKIGRAHV